MPTPETQLFSRETWVKLNSLAVSVILLVANDTTEEGQVQAKQLHTALNLNQSENSVSIQVPDRIAEAQQATEVQQLEPVVTFYVNPEGGSCINSEAECAECYTSLANAIEAAESGVPTRILLEDGGDYSTEGTRLTVDNGKIIFIATETSNTDPLEKPAVISGENLSSIFYVEGPETKLYLQELVLTDGHFEAHGGNAGGITAYNNAEVTLNNILIENMVGKTGGGVVVVEASAHIHDSTIQGCSSEGYGGGVSGFGINDFHFLFITDSTIQNNTAQMGGGIDISQSHSPYITLYDLSITDNSATYVAPDGKTHGSGLFTRGSTLQISDTTIRNDQTPPNPDDIATEFYGGSYVVYDPSSTKLGELKVTGDSTLEEGEVDEPQLSDPPGGEYPEPEPEYPYKVFIPLALND
jgi:hypothetical protein